MSTTDPKARVKADTHVRLSKYGTPQLISKLDAGTLLGLSKEVAIEILEKRKQDVSKYKGETWTKPRKTTVEQPEEEEEETPTSEDAPTTPIAPPVKVEKTPKKEKAPKTEKVAAPKVEKKAKEEKVRKSVTLIDETDKKVAKVIADENITKTEKIISLLEMGYSVNQISKSSLKAHYSFCHTIANNLKSNQEDK